MRWRVARTHATRAGRTQLQRGHRTNAVESATHAHSLMKPQVLQRGHRTNAVESPRPARRPTRPPPGFNGATARMRWRAIGARVNRARKGFNGATARMRWRERDCCRTESQCALRASTGPPHETRRGMHAAEPECNQHRFNGATARMRWRESIPSEPRAVTIGFNGATARMRWRDRRGKRRQHQDNASTGPPHETPERRTPPGQHGPPYAASTGPPHETRREILEERAIALAKKASTGPPHECGGERRATTAPSRHTGFNGATHECGGELSPVTFDAPASAPASTGPPHECGGEVVIRRR